MAVRSTQVERWGMYELAVVGPADGNPFTAVRFDGRFCHGHREVPVAGFYDGEGIYRLRFMPDEVGEWSVTTSSNIAALHDQQATFTCVAPAPGVHGPVAVRDTFHWAYADGTAYFPFGSTCYAWTHQGDALEEQTLRTLGAAPFNKLRMCVFPKDYAYNRNEPPLHPFARAADGNWDWMRFNPAFFRHLEQRVGQLRDLGIEADLILFHPYDRWGYAAMGAAADDRYLRYLVARLAAFRNVWWSLANEYDLMPDKSTSDWDRLFRLVQEQDPYQHPRSVHNCHGFYDHAKPWVTHQSIQHWEVRRVPEWRASYGKAVVIDECGYEGNIPHGWGNWSAREMVHRFWVGVASGGYVGHGETYLHPQEILWWSKGGMLHGESAPRIAFLRRIIETHVQRGLEPLNAFGSYSGREGERYFLFYLAEHQPAEFVFRLPARRHYRAEVIDPWQMTVVPCDGVYSDEALLRLPGKPYLAVQFVAVQNEASQITGKDAQ